ncbi:MAG: ParB/RepB/Spo0J family partition protein [Armatimonadota bacterium]|jgi:ParB family chromosome partitioning protein
MAQVQTIAEIDIDKIRLNPFQPRKSFNEERLLELAESIRANGVIEPIVVRPFPGGAFELVAGERRFRASVRAGLKKIPAVCRVMDDRKSLEIALIENIQREDINPLECAEAYKRLIEEFRLTQEQVAERVGKRRSTVANTLRLLSLPEPILKSLAAEEITEGHARAILSLQDQRAQMRLWQQVLLRGLSVRDTEGLARSPESLKSQRRKLNVARATAGVDANLANVEDKLRRFLGTRVAITRSGGSKGRIEIDFYDDEDLMRILDLMSQI